jgi:hypothetical protein
MAAGSADGGLLPQRSSWIFGGAGLWRLWAEPEQLLGDLVGGVAREPVAGAGDEHEAGARYAGGGGANVVGRHQPVCSPDSSRVGQVILARSSPK